MSAVVELLPELLGWPIDQICSKHVAGTAIYLRTAFDSLFCIVQVAALVYYSSLSHVIMMAANNIVQQYTGVATFSIQHTCYILLSRVELLKPSGIAQGDLVSCFLPSSSPLSHHIIQNILFFRSAAVSLTIHSRYPGLILNIEPLH